ncbi:MAG: leucyl aminopeptidase [Intrasporangium sp.]|uniref:leucyl aminopeptidase n=1 Tax=Intrasporangium sp. TaxID=1925024 RepID=UPI002647D511|nr:leucyl aminopeptidase [Intrasporangium sp.]MDN5796609.1 leucyl aminopeptidase [Intrasporangium sp.]
MAQLTSSSRSAADIDADAVVILLAKDGDRAVLTDGHGLSQQAVGHLTSVISELELKGGPGEVTTLAAVPGVTAARVVLAGAGELADGPAAATHEHVRQAVGAATRGLEKKTKVAVVVPNASPDLLAAVAEGAALGAYTPAKAGSTSTPKAQGITVLGPTDGPARKAIKRAAAIGSAVAYARDLVNQPPNLLFPESFVTSLGEHVKGTKVKLKSLDLKQLRAGGYGGIVGVGQGSVNEPRLAVLTYAPARPKAKLAFVGKGITFDSGGLCIKPADGMLTMKSDMAGAAAVAAAVLAIAELGLPVAVTGYLGIAENMPSGTAQRPSDVVTMRGGKTVEILNTDAEGRMVLGDCIALAGEGGPDAIVDIATLTGAQVIALAGTAAVMGRGEQFRARIVAAADVVGEAVWPMPLPSELRPSLDSPNADIAHKGGREGGMLTAGIFLGEFVPEGIDWGHIDIAGPSFNDKSAHGYTPKGGTGFGVRTLVGLAESYL